MERRKISGQFNIKILLFVFQHNTWEYFAFKKVQRFDMAQSEDSIRIVSFFARDKYINEILGRNFGTNFNTQYYQLQHQVKKVLFTSTHPSQFYCNDPTYGKKNMSVQCRPRLSF